MSETPGGANADDLRTHKTFAKAGTISPYAVPERWMFVGELDKTSVGKIDKKRLREQVAAGHIDIVHEPAFAAEDC